MTIRVAVLASGAGSNAEQIIRYFAKNDSVKIGLLLSNKEGCGALCIAQQLGIKSVYMPKETINDGHSLRALMSAERIEFIVLAGFLLKIPADVLQVYKNRVLNIHPSLLPKYGGKGMYGMHVHEAVLQNNEMESGITIHYVNEQLDDGQIVFQAKTDVLPNDTSHTLAERVHALEHKHYSTIIEQVLSELYHVSQCAKTTNNNHNET